MGRYAEKASYAGFLIMCGFWRFNMTGWAAFAHDFTSLVLGFGIFVEGARLV